MTTETDIHATLSELRGVADRLKDIASRLTGSITFKTAEAYVQLERERKAAQDAAAGWEDVAQRWELKAVHAVAENEVLRQRLSGMGRKVAEKLKDIG